MIWYDLIVKYKLWICCECRVAGVQEKAAFSVARGTDEYPERGRVIRFTNVITNINDDYNIQTGRFRFKTSLIENLAMCTIFSVRCRHDTFASRNISRVSVTDWHKTLALFSKRWENTIETWLGFHWVMLCDQKNKFSTLSLSHSKKHCSGSSKFWQVLFTLQQLHLLSECHCCYYYYFDIFPSIIPGRSWATLKLFNATEISSIGGSVAAETWCNI